MDLDRLRYLAGLNIFEASNLSQYSYHLTDVTATIDILKNSRFVLGKDKNEYFMSFARSVKSGFFTFMIGPDSVMLVVDRTKLYSDFNTKQYTNDEGAKELNFNGIQASEHEDRIINDSNIINIPNVGSLIKEIRVLIMDERSKGSDFFTEEQFQELEILCKKNGIVLKVVNSKRELRLKK